MAWNCMTCGSPLGQYGMMLDYKVEADVLDMDLVQSGYDGAGYVVCYPAMDPCRAPYYEQMRQQRSSTPSSSPAKDTALSRL